MFLFLKYLHKGATTAHCTCAVSSLNDNDFNESINYIISIIVYVDFMARPSLLNIWFSHALLWC